MTTAALHLHTTYSDGEMTLAELRDVVRGEGCTVAFVTDHADYFDAASLAAYAAECATLSTDGFRFVAGLEFPCQDRMHVLGYGVTAAIDSDDPETVFAHIEAHGGVAVIAHPKDDHFDWIERFTTLPMGIETWNTKYDGRYAPRQATFALLARLQARRPEMRAFYGLDLHYRSQFRGLLTTLEGADPLAALARGAYCARHGDLELPSDGRVPAAVTAQLERAARRSGGLRRWGKKVAPHLPKALKDPIRRFF